VVEDIDVTRKLALRNQRISRRHVTGKNHHTNEGNTEIMNLKAQESATNAGKNVISIASVGLVIAEKEADTTLHLIDRKDTEKEVGPAHPPTQGGLKEKMKRGSKENTKSALQAKKGNVDEAKICKERRSFVKGSSNEKEMNAAAQQLVRLYPFHGQNPKLSIQLSQLRIRTKLTHQDRALITLLKVQNCQKFQKAQGPFQRAIPAVVAIRAAAEASAITRQT
jgi:hypothetical protein